MSNDWLTRALEESRARGYLGPRAIEGQIEHSIGFARCWEGISPLPPASLLDLGSGGGLPGLVLAERWDCRTVLVDSMAKRMNLLREVLEWPGAPSSIRVITGRAESLARDPSLESTFDLVTARSFGPPSVVAECAVRFLRVGGTLIVSEPPEDDEARWIHSALRAMGLEDQGRIRHGAAFRVLTKVAATPTELPRGVGIPAKKPLF
jgi:16S rRNA (guanine527-N7)-methyltransferase